MRQVITESIASLQEMAFLTGRSRFTAYCNKCKQNQWFYTSIRRCVVCKQAENARYRNKYSK